jgi:glycerate kinase
MKIVIAPDSYKESLSALEVATAIERGFREIFPEAVYVKLPVADGGEGTVEAMIAATRAIVCSGDRPAGRARGRVLWVVRRRTERLY